MTLLLLLSLLMQALVGLGALLLLGQARRQQPESWQGVLFASQLGFALAAASAASSLPAHWLAGGAWQEASAWLEQAHRLLGQPLLALAVLTLARHWHWSRPAWGRAILGLCAFFELFRQMGHLADYRLLLELGSLALLLYGGLLHGPSSRPLRLALAALPAFVGAGLVLHGRWALPAFVVPLLLSLAYGLLLWLLLSLLALQKPQE